MFIRSTHGLTRLMKGGAYQLIFGLLPTDVTGLYGISNEVVGAVRPASSGQEASGMQTNSISPPYFYSDMFEITLKKTSAFDGGFRRQAAAPVCQTVRGCRIAWRAERSSIITKRGGVSQTGSILYSYTGTYISLHTCPFPFPILTLTWTIVFMVTSLLFFLASSTIDTLKNGRRQRPRVDYPDQFHYSRIGMGLTFHRIASCCRVCKRVSGSPSDAR